MSAYFAVAYADRIEVVADGARVNLDGTFAADINKIEASPLLPLAVTGVGVEGDLAAMKIEVLKATFEPTVDHAIARLRRELPKVTQRGTGESVILVMAISESEGPVLFTYSNVHKHVHYRVRTHAFGPELATHQLIDLVGDFSFPNGLREDGVRLLEAMRAAECEPFGLPSGHYVGGHIDHAVIDRDGVRIERVHEWADVIGQKINPSPVNRGAFSRVVEGKTFTSDDERVWRGPEGQILIEDDS